MFALFTAIDDEIAARSRQTTVHARDFAWQLLLSGVESVRFILILAVLVGISVVVQLEVWTGRVGQSEKLGQLLVAVVARELAPLFANFVLIVRGGSTMASESGLMKIGGEVRVLEAQGVEPLQRWFARKYTFDVLLPKEGPFGLSCGDEVFIFGVSVGSGSIVTSPMGRPGRDSGAGESALGL